MTTTYFSREFDDAQGHAIPQQRPALVPASGHIDHLIIDQPLVSEYTSRLDITSSIEVAAHTASRVDIWWQIWVFLSTVAALVLAYTILCSPATVASTPVRIACQPAPQGVLEI